MSVRTRRPLAVAATTLALGGLALAGAPAASAAPGDNGDVKIHKETTAVDDQRNDPKVCRFYLAAFNFDGLQQVSWSIAPQPAKADEPKLSGGITLDAGGDGHTEELVLPDGMYKLTWTFVGQQGSAKHKVFRVDCPGGGPGGGPGGNGHHKPPHGPVGAGGGGSAQLAAEEDSSAFGIGAAVAAGLAGTAGLVLIRRSRRRNDGAA